MKELMNAEEQLVLLGELAQEPRCELSHGKAEHVDHAAVDWLIIPMGFVDQDGVETCTEKLTIPVCQECQEGLSSGEWYLFYCIGCGSSAWCLRVLSRRTYPSTLVTMRHCPGCHGSVN